MRDTNRSILWLGGLTILLLSGGILFKVAGLMRELQASYTDELTGLANRARLLQVLQRHPPAALIILDIDRFRELNALFGHDCGDYILSRLVARLRDWLQTDSTVGSGRLYRLGSDQFVWQGPELPPDPLAACVQQLAQLGQSLPLQWQGHAFHISVTLGASSSFETSPEQPPDLISEAQEALKQARQKGISYQLHDRTRSLEQQFEHNLLWANRLREALRTDRLQPWFQPIYSLATGQVEKYECLVRMLDTEGQVVSPGLFLGVARQLRLDRQITRLMVEKCCRRFAGTGLQFSINLSYGDLRDEQLIAFILEQLDSHDVGPQLIFEILESDGIDNYDQVRHFIEQVKKRGCRIAIDDFGTGYSNFEHLLRLDVDLIKIDGSLIRHLHTDPGSRRVVQGIVSFAHSLQMQTLAEFVHSEAVLEQVRALGIDFAQGEVIGMPQPELLPPEARG
jgi:diguanylate cyclase (GGDEF)-like protein